MIWSASALYAYRRVGNEVDQVPSLLWFFFSTRRSSSEGRKVAFAVPGYDWFESSWGVSGPLICTLDETLSLIMVEILWFFFKGQILGFVQAKDSKQNPFLRCHFWIFQIPKTRRGVKEQWYRGWSVLIFTD